ncbi:MAG: penicillin-binding protein 2 [Alphaproteobacteria bacterium]|nr:penicillin-binding protein 2 [Alphaproteobacteria bacterium]
MQRRDNDRQRVFTRRAALLAGGQLLLLGGLAARMYQMQVVESRKYQTLAEENRINLRLLAPSRGRILDRFGVPLAVNQRNYRVVVTAENSPDVADTLGRLSRLVSLSDDERVRILREIRRKRKFVPVTVREYLSWDEVALVEVNAPDLPGVSIEVGELRAYPSGAKMAHILGYVAAVAQEDMDGDPLLDLPGFRIGRNGIERQFDAALRGRAGASQLEVNALGRIIRELDRRESEPGQDVVLTLDAALQRTATARIGEESGAVVVMEAATGAVLALASTPSYDPNAFVQGLTPAEWSALADDERAPLRNKAVAGEFAPGSTFKMVVALAALEAGAVDAQTQFYCPGYMELGDGKFHCWREHGHGSVDLARGIAESCDVYFYETARRVGIDRIAAMATKLGLGRRLGFDLPGERAGLIPTRAWKTATLGQGWVLGETLVAGIGQGYIVTTPLQLAVMTARIVNGGRAVVPHVARDVVQGRALAARLSAEAPSLGIAPRNLALVVDAMAAVINGARGTARVARLDVGGQLMGGKTGTSQVRRISRAERLAGVRKNSDLPWRHRDHALFVAFAPVAAPRYVCAVVVEHGGGGSAVAAPIARDVMAEVLRRYPSREAPGAGVATLPAHDRPS